MVALTKEKNELQVTGVYGSVWQEFAKSTGLEYEVLESSSYGSLDEDGKWNGMIGMVHRNEADIAVADFSPTSARKEVVNFCSLMDSAG